MAHARQEFALGTTCPLGALQGLPCFGNRRIQQRGTLAHQLLELVLIDVQIKVPFFEFLQHLVEAVDQGAKFIVDVFFGPDREVLAFADVAHELHQITQRVHNDSLQANRHYIGHEPCQREAQEHIFQGVL